MPSAHGANEALPARTPVAYAPPHSAPHPGLLAPAPPPHTHSARVQLLAELMREARDVPPEVMATVRGGMPIPAVYESTYRSDLKAHDLTGKT